MTKLFWWDLKKNNGKKIFNDMSIPWRLWNRPKLATTNKKREGER